MRHAVFALIAGLFIVTIAQNWGHYTTALAIAAWVRYDGRLNAKIF